MQDFKLKSFSGRSLEEAQEKALDFVLSEKLDLLDRRADSDRAGIAQVRPAAPGRAAAVSVYYTSGS